MPVCSLEALVEVVQADELENEIGYKVAYGR